MKSRQHVYFDKALAARLDAHTVRTGASKSSVVTAAVRAYLDARGAKELNDLLGIRLGRIERDQQVILESLALFVRYQLTVTAPLPEADQAALATGQDRFRAFIDQVGRRIASGRGFSHELILRTGESQNAAP
jgi:hypothetical protein